MDQRKIGSFISACRREKGWTQVQLAERLGVTNKSVSKWETGKCLPDASLFGDLCDSLGITVNELFAGERIEAEHAARKAEENLTAAMEEIREKDESAARRMKAFRTVRVGMLVLLCISLLCTVDCGINYFYNLMYEFHDHSFTLAGVLAPFCYPDYGWSLALFWESFRNSLTVTAVLAAANIALACIAVGRK